MALGVGTAMLLGTLGSSLLGGLFGLGSKPKQPKMPGAPFQLPAQQFIPPTVQPMQFIPPPVVPPMMGAIQGAMGGFGGSAMQAAAQAAMRRIMGGA